MARVEVNEIVAVEASEVVLPRYVSWTGIFIGALSALGLPFWCSDSRASQWALTRSASAWPAGTTSA
jgi:hypothetical protein